VSTTFGGGVHTGVSDSIELELTDEGRGLDGGYWRMVRREDRDEPERVEGSIRAFWDVAVADEVGGCRADCVWASLLSVFTTGVAGRTEGELSALATALLTLSSRVFSRCSNIWLVPRNACWSASWSFLSCSNSAVSFLELKNDHNTANVQKSTTARRTRPIGLSFILMTGRKTAQHQLIGWSRTQRLLTSFLKLEFATENLFVE